MTQSDGRPASPLIMRVAKLVFYVLAFFVAISLLHIESRGFYYSLGLLFGLNIFWLLAFRGTWFSEKTQSVAGIALDVLLENVLIHFSGGVQSPFIFLLIFDVLLGAYVLSRRQMYFLTFFVALSYAGFTLVAYLGYLPSFLTTLNVFEIHADVYIYYLVLMRVFIFMMIGYLALQFSTQIHTQQATIAQMQNLTEKILFQLRSGLITVDADDRIIYSNKSAADLLKQSNPSLLGKYWPQPFFRPDYTLDKEFLAKADSLDGVEFVVEREGFSRIPIALSISRLLDNRNRELGKTIFFRDLTHEKEIEKLISDQKRTRALEEMSRTLAHEIKNPLASICGSLEVLNESHLFEDFKSKRLVQVILKESERLSRILKDFLTFSGEIKLSKHVQDVGLILDDLFMVLQHNDQISNKIQLIKAWDSETAWMADVDRDAFTQMVLNLVLNGAQAIKESGHVTVSLKSHRFKESLGMRLSVEDNGEGIEPSLQDEICKPFFTRRAKGMGLGLSVCQKIIEGHGWQFILESSPGEGTTIGIVFPRSENPS